MIRPLFGDVLSCGFQPVTDNLRRTHRLGRLAHATFDKGDLSATGEYFTAHYRPSWAPHVSSMVSGTIARELFVMERIDLASDDEVSMSVTNHSGLAAELERIDGRIITQELIVGTDLNFFGEAVATAADAFFRQTHGSRA